MSPEAAARASRARASQSSIAGDSVTGVLLVGGASRRFGAPKALATLHGETLAERAWRALAWCAERIAVGKRDGPALPFPVADDGAELRAPIVGVAGGLRLARHELCLFLPVDCPLVGEAELRTLAAQVAVAPTGPLPGAYTRAMLPELEARIGRGELSLRGINPRAAALDPARFANVNTEAQLRALGPA